MVFLALVMAIGIGLVGNRESQAAFSEPAIAPVMMSSPLAPPPVTGSTYYVDKNNLGGACSHNNPGTQTQPWCTIKKAMQTLRAGDRAYIRAGTYSEGSLRPSNSGTPGNYITFQAYPGETPVINCTRTNLCIDGWSSGAASYIVYNGLEIYGPEQIISCQGTSGCHHIWMVNGKYHDYHKFFIERGAHNIVLSNNEIYNVRDQAISVGEDSNGIIIEFNRLYDNGRDADDDGAAKCFKAWNCVMRYNTVYNNYRNPSSSRSCFNPGNCQGVTGLYIDLNKDGSIAGAMSYIYNNTLYNNDIGIQVYETSGVRVFNNVVYNNGHKPGSGQFVFNYGMGITISNSSSNVWVDNNTIYGNENEAINLHGTGSDIRVRNNIIMSNGGGIAGSTSGKVVSNNITGGVAFANAAAGDFHLAPGSSAINGGTAIPLYKFDRDNAARPQGGAYDVGAYEYGGSGHRRPPRQPQRRPPVPPPHLRQAP